MAPDVPVVPVEAVVVASVLRSGEGDFLSDLEESSVAAAELELESDLFEPPPNILFNSRPPCEERLRRLFPARFSGRGNTLGLDVQGPRSESYVRDSCWKVRLSGDDHEIAPKAAEIFRRRK